MEPTRVAELKTALASDDPVSRIGELMADYGTRTQAIVSYACQCIEMLKQDSGLWDVLNTLGGPDYEHGVAEMSAVLDAIGAARARADFSQLETAFKGAVRDSGDELTAYISVAEDPLAEPIQRAAPAHAREIEDGLLRFCAANIEELAAEPDQRQTSSETRETRLARLRDAVAGANPLSDVRELLPDTGEGAQEVVVYGYACILETNSAGLSILLDRFDDVELGRFDRSLESIGAKQTLADLRRLAVLFRGAISEGQDRLRAAETVGQSTEAQRIDRAAEAHVREMETLLLDFCKTHLEELAAG
jgi:hypothetical protein